MSAEGGARSVDPDHSALEVDQRATGVASGDRGIGLIIAAAVNRHSRALTTPRCDRAVGSQRRARALGLLGQSQRRRQ